MPPRKKATKGKNVADEKKTVRKPAVVKKNQPKQAKQTKTETTVIPERKNDGSWLFKKGQSGNPAGRPKGSRHKLDEAFISALCAEFENVGIEAIRRVSEADPAMFLNLVAKVLPKHIETRVQVNLTELSDDELANIAAGGRSRTVETPEYSAQLN